MKFRWLSLRVQLTVKNIKNVVCIEQRAEDEVDRDGCGAAYLRKLQGSERGEERPVRSGLCLSLQKILLAIAMEGPVSH